MNRPTQTVLVLACAVLVDLQLPALDRMQLLDWIIAVAIGIAVGELLARIWMRT